MKMTHAAAKREALAHQQEIEKTTARNIRAAALASEEISRSVPRPPIQRHYSEWIGVCVPGTEIVVDYEVWVAEFGSEQSGHDTEAEARRWLLEKSEAWRRQTAVDRASAKLRNMARRAIAAVQDLEDNAAFFAAQDEIAAGAVLDVQQRAAVAEAVQVLAVAFGFWK